VEGKHAKYNKMNNNLENFREARLLLGEASPSSPLLERASVEKFPGGANGKNKT